MKFFLNFIDVFADKSCFDFFCLVSPEVKGKQEVDDEEFIPNFMKNRKHPSDWVEVKRRSRSDSFKV